MCGISAIFTQNEKREELLKQSLAKILHRGSSNFEYEILPGVAMGTNRLPIVGRLSGKQPVSNEDRTVFAILNGEIFNYKELRTTLIEKGHAFRGDSDTEVLVHLYEDYGTAMVEHLDSEMFAFVVFDTKAGDMYAARDRFGVKPLFYAVDPDGGYHFASELKQLVQFDFIDSVQDFPPAHYMLNGELTRYYEMRVSNDVTDESEAVRTVTQLIVDAVRKRVDTDLPVAVLLSGGVDSSLVMEIANRLHPDVTGYILGRPGASDFEAAVRLCKEYGYKYKVVYPDVDYAEEVEQVLYHLELYEAQVIRHSFALDILARAVVRDGYRVALAGDASDELFGGYNEFVRLASEDINKGCEQITISLARSHNVRLDRMSMKHTLEVRAPFFDTKVVEYAMRIDGSLKVKRTDDHVVTTKYILRRVADQFLPDYIARRFKVPFSNGAGMNVGFNFRSQDGDVARAVLTGVLGSLHIDEHEKAEHGFLTQEEEIYFAMYKECSYQKLAGHTKRIITKETLCEIGDGQQTLRIVAAEFDRMALYFPVYLAERLGLYAKRDLDVSFLSTGGDDLTYNALFSGSAQIGISDPVFSFSNAFPIKGKIFGSLVHRAPVVAVTINPAVEIAAKEDLKKYRVGTYQDFSTTNTLVRCFLPDLEVRTIHHRDMLSALKSRDIDVAFVSLDLAHAIVGVGGRIVYKLADDAGEYLFTGFTVSDNLDQLFTPAIAKFTAAVKESMVFLGNFPEESRHIFETMFPDVGDSAGFLHTMKGLWHKKIDEVIDGEVLHAEQAWSAVHPDLLKATHPSFVPETPAHRAVDAVTTRDISREIPYREDDLTARVEDVLRTGTPLKLLAFWGASDKAFLTNTDYALFDKIDLVRTRLYEHRVPTTVTIILTDMHAELNGYKGEQYRAYLDAVMSLASSRDCRAQYLSTIWERDGLQIDHVNAGVRSLTAEKWSGIRISTMLEKSAAKRGHVDVVAAAKKYYVARKLENVLLEESFSDAVCVTFSDDRLQEIYPELPTLYVWPYTRGKVDALPWFAK